VSPGWMAVLPQGTQTELPVWTHQQLIAHPQALQRLAQDLGR
jgi:triacylglycerol lipase